MTAESCICFRRPPPAIMTYLSADILSVDIILTSKGEAQSLGKIPQLHFIQGKKCSNVEFSPCWTDCNCMRLFESIRKVV